MSNDLVAKLQAHEGAYLFPKKADKLLEEAATEIQRLRRIEELARVWSAYQDDDSQKDQETDMQLRIQAKEAAVALYEAVS